MMGFVAKSFDEPKENDGVWEIKFDTIPNNDKDLREIHDVKIWSENKEELQIFYEMLKNNQNIMSEESNVFLTNYEQNDKLIPVIYQPVIDSWKNFLREIHVRELPDKFNYEVTLIFNDENHPAGVYAAKISLAKIHFSQCNEQNASEILQEYIDSDFLKNDLRSLSEMSSLYKTKKNYQKAIHLNEIRLVNTKSKEEKAKILLEMCMDLENLGDFTSCKRLLRDAQRLTVDRALQKRILSLISNLEKIH